MSEAAPETPAPVITAPAPAPKAQGSPVIPLLLLAGGAYLTWFAIHYWRGQGALVWPSTPIKSVLQGNGLPAPDEASSSSTELTSYESSLQSASAAQAARDKATTAPSVSSIPSGPAQHIARLLLPQFGWGAGQFAPLVQLWTRESGWRPNARNPTSGALGIAQALGHGTPGSASHGEDEYGAEYGLTAAQAQQANAGSARYQILWGLGYIKARYGSPSAAWAHETANGWY